MVEHDVIVAGGGVNALVCALVLARSGLGVVLVEQTAAVGGMHRTEFPFAKAPRLAAATGAHRVGFVPPSLEAHLGVRLPLAARTPARFVPTTGARFLLDDHGLDDGDRAALGAMHAELEAMRQDLAQAWTAMPTSVEEVSERWIRAPLREAFVRLCRGSLAEYAARFGMQDNLLKGALVADALGGSFASWDAPGSGAPLLVRTAPELVPVGGLGALAKTLLEAAQTAGVQHVAGTVTQIVVEGNTAVGVLLADGTMLHGGAVVSGADPWRMRALVGVDRFNAEYVRKVDALARSGGSAKLVVALDELPRFTCLPDDHGQHRAVTFLLPEDDTVRALGRAFADAAAGRLSTEAPVECTFATEEDGRHSASLVVPWVPYDLAGTTWSSEEERFTGAVLDVLERFAPGTRAHVVDAVLWHPKKLETHFGVMRGRLAHVDDTLVFADRLAPTTPISGLYTCGPASAPAGNVFGVPGLATARQVVSDFELALERTEVGMRPDGVG